MPAVIPMAPWQPEQTPSYSPSPTAANPASTMNSGAARGTTGVTSGWAGTSSSPSREKVTSRRIYWA